MFLLSELGLYQPTAFWPSRFLMRNMKIILLRVSCTWQFASLIAFNILFVLSSTIWLQCVSSCVSLRVFYLEFIELLEHLYSCFSSNGEFSTIISSNNLYAPLSLFISLSGSLTMCMFAYLCSPGSFSSVHFSSVFFHLFPLVTKTQ